MAVVSLACLGTLAACSDDAATTSADGGTNGKPSKEEATDAGSTPHDNDNDAGAHVNDSDESGDSDT